MQEPTHGQLSTRWRVHECTTEVAPWYLLHPRRSTRSLDAQRSSGMVQRIGAERARSRALAPLAPAGPRRGWATSIGAIRVIEKCVELCILCNVFL